MERTALLKFLGLCVLFGLLAAAQPIARELSREVSTLQSALREPVASAVQLVASPLSEPSIEQNVLGATTNATDSAALFEAYPVEKVVDGDTVKVSINGVVETIRVIGINTPETVDPRKPVECFGREASEYAKKLLMGHTVTLEADPSQGDRDKYGRLLRYVFLQDGSDYGGQMIAGGYAYEYTYDEPYRYQQQYRAAQAQATADAVGLWAQTACQR
jgi:micrococcal nuclease